VTVQALSLFGCNATLVENGVRRQGYYLGGLE